MPHRNRTTRHPPPPGADRPVTSDPGAAAEWRHRARCRDPSGEITRLFFSHDIFEIARAKAICARCPVRVPCLRSAVERAEPWGVWGGELFEDGRIVAVKRPPGRPPRERRPDPVVDEVPWPRTRTA